MIDRRSGRRGFDRDGRTDIVVGGGNGGPLGMYHNLGDGTFVDSAHYVTGGYPDAIAANDLDHDGTLDLVTANNTSGTLSVLFNAGDGSFRNQVPLLVGSRPASVAAGDFDDDGRPDLVSTSWGYLGTTSVLTGASVLRNLGGGRFDTPLLYDAGPAPEQLAIACGSLLRRTSALDAETCPRCGGRMCLMRQLRAASEG